MIPDFVNFDCGNGSGRFSTCVAVKRLGCFLLWMLCVLVSIKRTPSLGGMVTLEAGMGEAFNVNFNVTTDLKPCDVRFATLSAMPGTLPLFH